VKCLGRIAGYGGARQAHQPFSAARHCAMQITRNGRAEHCILLPGRIFRRQGAHAIKDEDKLRIDGLFHPKRAVIVIDRNALSGRDKMRAAFARDSSNEIQQRACPAPFLCTSDLWVY